MSNMQANPQSTTPGFWKRLVLAAEAMCESYEEQLEKRVSSLEAAVAVLRKSRRSAKGTEPTVT